MNIDIAFLIILIATNVGTYFYTKELVIKQTIEYLERLGLLHFDED
jgi:hypothetical protein|tara:strand:+ start:4009 stop:4146 length:138 start_codon:yes stop_codon:yes gene_type:complete